MSSDAANLIPPRTFPSSSLTEINLILFSPSCSGLETFTSRGTIRSPKAGPLLILSQIILHRSEFCLLPDRFGCFKMAENWRKKFTQHDSSYGFATMSSSALLRSYPKEIRACLRTRFKMVGFAFVTAIRVSTVRGNGSFGFTT